MLDKIVKILSWRNWNVTRDDLFDRIMRNAGVILFGNTTASAINLVSLTILARQLGPEELAVFVLAQTYAYVINDLFNIQTWESMIKFGSLRKTEDGVANVIQTNLLLDSGSAIIAVFFGIMLLQPSMQLFDWAQANYLSFLLYTLSIAFNLTSMTIGVPRYYDKFSVVVKVNISISLIKLFAIIGVVFLSKTLLAYIIIYLLAEVLGNLVLIFYSVRLLNRECGSEWWKQKFHLDKKQFLFIWWSNLRTVVSIPIYHLDMIVISSVVSLKMVGVYKVYKETASIIHRLSDPVNQSIYPEFTRILGDNGKSQALSLIKKTMITLSLAGVLMFVFFILFSGLIVEFLFGVEYLDDLNVLYWLCCLYVLSFITIPMNSLFLAAGFARYNFIILLVTNIVYLASAYLGGILFGLYGLLIAYGMQLLLNRGGKIYYMYRYSSDWGGAIR